MRNVYERILLIGSNGMLAGAVGRALAARGLEAVGRDVPAIDITQHQSVADAFAEVRPTLVFNCAAYTAVDKAEEQEELATKINGDGPGNLAHACREHGATLVHYSTDFVFDGSSTEPYKVTDKPNPVSAYGRSKLAGEVAIENSGLADFLTIRTAWLYGPTPTGRPFPKVILDVAKAGKPLRVVADQHGSPTYTEDLAGTTLALLDASARGLFHVTNGGRTTWFEFAKATLETFGVTPVSLDKQSATDWKATKPDSANRPAFSVLDLTRVEQAIGRPMRPWREALATYCNATGGNP